MRDSEKREWRWSLDDDPESVNGINESTLGCALLERLEAVVAELREIRVILGRETQPHVQGDEAGGKSSEGGV